MRRLRDRDSDKERILRNIALALDRAAHVSRDQREVETVVGMRMARVDCWDNEPVAQFIPLQSYTGVGCLPPPGTIVRCGTNPHHDWGISRYVQGSGNDRVDPWILREIGSDRLLQMRNERLEVLIGVPAADLLEGWEWKVYLWSQKALLARYNEKADEFDFRWRGAEVLHLKERPDTTVIRGSDSHELHYEEHVVLRIQVGRHIWVDSKNIGGVRYRYKYRTFDVPVHPKIRLKDIVADLVAQGCFSPWREDELEAEAA
jgi:hypothetical protein